MSQSGLPTKTSQRMEKSLHKNQSDGKKRTLEGEITVPFSDSS